VSFTHGIIVLARIWDHLLRPPAETTCWSFACD